LRVQRLKILPLEINICKMVSISLYSENRMMLWCNGFFQLLRNPSHEGVEATEWPIAVTVKENKIEKITVDDSIFVDNSYTCRTKYIFIFTNDYKRTNRQHLANTIFSIIFGFLKVYNVYCVFYKKKKKKWRGSIYFYFIESYFKVSVLNTLFYGPNESQRFFASQHKLYAASDFYVTGGGIILLLLILLLLLLLWCYNGLARDDFH
jgi:hypothetical protein